MKKNIIITHGRRNEEYIPKQKQKKLNDCCACFEEDRDYFMKKCEMDMQISYTELVEDLKQLKDGDNNV